MPLPPRLEKELQELRRDFVVDVTEEGADWINLIFQQFPIGDAYKVPVSDLLIRVQRTYPDAGPDMFWLEVPVLLKTGQTPQNADLIEAFMGRQWRRFSWHRSKWNASIENLHSYLEFIRRRLKENR